MKKMVVLGLALVILLFVTSCTVGKAYESSAAGDGTGINADYVGACGDGTASVEENCLNCPADVVCAGNEVCEAGICNVLPLPGTPYKVIDADGKEVGASFMPSSWRDYRPGDVFNKNVVNGTTLYAFLSYDIYTGKFDPYSARYSKFFSEGPSWYESEDCSVPLPMPPLHTQRRYIDLYQYEMIITSYGGDNIVYEYKGILPKYDFILDPYILTCDKNAMNYGGKFGPDPLCFRLVKTNLDPNSEEGQKPIRSMRLAYNSTKCIPVNDFAYNHTLYESIPIPKFKGPFKIVFG